MSGNDEKDVKLFSRVLRHFSERLVALQEDEIKHGNEILKQDMIENSKRALEMAQDMDDGKTANPSNDTLTLIKSALELYKKDLEVSTESLIKKLGITISHKNVDDTIRLINNNLEHRRWKTNK